MQRNGPPFPLSLKRCATILDQSADLRTAYANRAVVQNPVPSLAGQCIAVSTAQTASYLHFIMFVIHMAANLTPVTVNTQAEPHSFSTHTAR